MTTTQDTHSERNEQIAKAYLEDSSLTLRAVGEQHGLGADRVRLIVLEVTGLSPKEIAERRSQHKIQGIIKQANDLLDKDETITRSSDLFHPLGVSNEFVRAHSAELSDVLDRIKIRRHRNDHKVGNKFSDDDILDAIRQSYRKAKDAVAKGKQDEFKYFTLPLYEAYRNEGDPSRATIVSRMGWNEACERINEFPHIKPRGSKQRFTKEDALNALRACAADLDKNPLLITVREYDEWHKSHSEHPYVLSIRKLFGRKWELVGLALAEADSNIKAKGA